MKIITGYTGEAHVTSDDAASLNRGIFGSNKDYILGGIGNEFSYETSSEETTITINTGDIVIDGVHARITSPETLTLDNGKQGQYRVDLVVAHYEKDASTSKESVTLQVIKGTSGATAVDPEYSTGNIGEGALTRDAVIYRIVRYDIGIESIQKVIGIYYSNSGNSPLMAKGSGEGYLAVGSYDSAAEGNATYIDAMDENKNSTARLIIYESGKIGFIKGDTFINIPFVQHGVANKKGNNSIVSIEVTFPKAYVDVPVVSLTSTNADKPPALVNVTNKGFTALFTAQTNGTNLYWIASGKQLA